MKKFLTVVLYALPLAVTPVVFAQTSSTAPATTASPVAPPTTAPGVLTQLPTGTTSTKIISGVSVKDKLMGKIVYNENDEKIGTIGGVVLASNGVPSAIVVGAGGFLGMGERNVAVPFDKVMKTNNKLVLAGYTKDQLKPLPEVKVAK